MVKNKTKQIGKKTARHTHRGMFEIEGKEAGMEYSFRRYVDIEQGGGTDMYGYEPVDKHNSKGEAWAAPRGVKPRGGTGQMRNMDTILCKRPEEAGDYFREEENERYNSQTQLVMTASKRANGKLRQINTGQQIAKVEGELTGSEYFTQRPGPTETEISKEE